MEKGKLRIYFGYSAGVGKTYSMLKDAQELAKDGIDVVIGYLEPHDRPNTMRMADGLERLPLKYVEYKGICLQEFDVDSAVQRKPELILVDELAHTNAYGSKNRKRYLDVEELINNGIDVYTTVNVQHIESLCDIVDSATSVDVNERIPDEIFDNADEVVLVDIEPNELIERMNDGEIYHETQARLALMNFFKEENLSELRQLFMRRSADRIEKQTNNGKLKTKILALISPSPSSAKNIRIASHQAEVNHCKFSAMYVETNGELSDENAQNLKNHMNLVRELGGEMIVKFGENVVDTVTSYVRLGGVTNLIIGKSWSSIGKKESFEDKFIVSMPNIEVLIVPDSSINYNHYSFATEIKHKCSALFKRSEKFKIANKCLDIINLLSLVPTEKSDVVTEMKVAEILARAFERSCMVVNNDCAVVAWRDEKVDFFDSQYEQAVLKWCIDNCKIAGKGSDTLREAKAIYFPLKVVGKIAVIAFSCKKGKMTVTDKIIFSQLTNILKCVFNFQ